MSSIKIAKYLIHLSIISFFIQGAFSQPLLINGRSHYTFKPYVWSYLKTQDAIKDVSDIINLYKSGKFQTTAQPVFNGGIPSEIHWFHFSIKNNDTSFNKLVIEIQNSRLNEIELFEVSGDSIKSFGRDGDFIPFDNRQLFYKNYIYKTDFHLHQVKEYYLFVNQVGHAFILPIKVYKERSFLKMVGRDYLFDGVLYGFLLFVSLLSFLFFINTSRILYLYYSLYILTAILWFLSYFGTGFQYLWSAYPEFNTISSPLFAAANILLNIQLCQNLLGIKKTNSRLYVVGLISKLLLVAAALFPVLFDLNHRSFLFNYVYLICFLSIIIYSVVIVLVYVLFYMIKGLLPAKFYFSASILKVISIFNLALLELGLSPALYNMETILQIGLLLEITLLTYALARNYSKQESSAREKERNKIARKIHNQISNYLSIVKLKVYNYNKHLKIDALSEIEADIKKAQYDARNISINLRPDYLKNESLSDAIQNYIAQIKSFDIKFHMQQKDIKISYALKEYIFEIVQELIANMIKHSHANQGGITLNINKKLLEITAKDNGIGIQLEGDQKDYGSGIKEIKAQVEKYNGSAHINSGKNNLNGGTVITIVVPNPKQITNIEDSLLT